MPDMTERCEICHAKPGEPFLDGYRIGLGEAISTLETVADKVPALCQPEETEAILRAIASGLRTISASTALADEQP